MSQFALRLDSPIYNERVRVPKYSTPQSPLTAPYSLAGKLLRARLQMDPDVHRAYGKAWIEEGYRVQRIYHQHVDRELGFLKAKGVDAGPLISGVVSDKFPDRVKDDLRKLARNVTECFHAAAAHYSAARAKHTTYLRDLGTLRGREH